MALHRGFADVQAQSNGLVEQFHHCLKAALCARCVAIDWFRQLPWILLSFLTTPAEASNISPAQQLYGASLTLPTQLQAVSPTEVADPLSPSILALP